MYLFVSFYYFSCIVCSLGSCLLFVCLLYLFSVFALVPNLLLHNLIEFVVKIMRVVIVVVVVYIFHIISSWGAGRAMLNWNILSCI